MRVTCLMADDLLRDSRAVQPRLDVKHLVGHRRDRDHLRRVRLDAGAPRLPQRRSQRRDHRHRVVSAHSNLGELEGAAGGRVLGDEGVELLLERLRWWWWRWIRWWW